MWQRISSPLNPILYSVALFLGFLTIARIIFVGLFFDHIAQLNDLWLILVNGVRIDLVLTSYILAVPALTLLFTNTFIPKFSKPIGKICIVWVAITFAMVFFMEAVTPLYILEYGTRPERKFFEYLIYPKEVFMMLAGTYGFTAVIILTATVFVIPLVYVTLKKTFIETPDWSFRKFLVVFPLVVLTLFACGRSSLDHRAINPSMIAFSDDVLLNNLPLNSSYSVLYAAYRLKDEEDSAAIYGKLPNDLIHHYVYENRPKRVNNSQLSSPPLNTFKNIVIVLEESLGARFVERLGGQALTPNLNQLADDGWWFTHLYATGTRSVRGIEAVTTGFLPTPGRSVVKLSGSQSEFFTIAALLKQFNYYSRFYYGGSAHFDNMKGFVLGNGFNEVVEQKNFKNAKYAGSWGVSDEDVFNQMHTNLQNSNQQPQLMVVLTTSNHTPFDFPVEAKDHYSQPLKSRENAIRYADKALGKFVAKARTSNYWDNSIFLIVADHDLRVADFTTAKDVNNDSITNKIFPVEGFHIPALILGGSITPKVTEAIASQIDLPTTLLSLAGIHASTPMLGVDLTTIPESYQGGAIMQFADYQAYLDGNKLVVLRPNQHPLTGFYHNREFQQAAIPQELKDKALAHALWASKAYHEQTYKLTTLNERS